MITPQTGDSRLAANGIRVNEGDTVTTFKGAESQLHMLDGAYLMVRENSRIKIETYVADGGDKDRSILDLIKGTARSITGWIGKYNRATYEIHTPILVTIGVRGTDHEVSYIPPGDPRGKPRVYDKVNESKAFMRSGTTWSRCRRSGPWFSAWGAKPHQPRGAAWRVCGKGLRARAQSASGHSAAGRRGRCMNAAGANSAGGSG